MVSLYLLVLESVWHLGDRIQHVGEVKHSSFIEIIIIITIETIGEQNVDGWMGRWADEQIPLVPECNSFYCFVDHSDCALNLHRTI